LSGDLNQINQVQIEILKNQTSAIIDMLVKNMNFGGNSLSSYIVGNDMLSSQFSLTDPTSTKLTIQDAIKNNLTIVNSDKCIETLKKYYNTTDDFIISKTQFSSLLKTTSEGVSDSTLLKIYNYKTRTEVNMSLCNNDEIVYKIPLNENIKNSLNLTTFQQLNQSNIDVFNPNNTYFTSVCSPYVDNNTAYDTTVNYRREHYFQNKSIECVGLECQYEGIDENYYIKCNCKQGPQPSSPEVFDITVDFFLQPLSQWNFEIITCYKVVFAPEVIYNVGLYVTIALASVNTFLLLLVNMFIKTEISLDIGKIIYYDCRFFEKDSMVVKKYFKRKSSNNETQNAKNNNKLFTRNAQSPQAVGRSEDQNILNLNVKTDDANILFENKNDEERIAQHNNYIEDMNDKANISENNNENEIEKKPDKIDYHTPITIGDYGQLGPLDIIRYDKRSFCKYLTDKLIMDHTIVSLIFKRSLFDPFFIRILKLIFQVSLQFCANALLFTDDYIDARALNQQKVNSL
jgi:hypothetical protein